MEINDQNLISLLDAANYLECKKAKDVISYYIFEKTSLKNYLFYYKLTNSLNMKSLNSYFCNILLQQYLLLEDVNCFYELNFYELSQILSCCELKISSELELFFAAINWINYRPTERRKHMSALLKLIRLHLLTHKVLNEVLKNHRYCKDSMSCKHIIDKAIKNKNSHTKTSSDIQFQNRYYSCKFETDKVMLVGGLKCFFDRQGNQEKTIKHETAKLNSFDGIDLINLKTTSKMNEQRSNCQVAAIGTRVYCFGGNDAKGKVLKSCEVYCRKTDSWNFIAPLPFDDWMYFCVCSFMNEVYLFGDDLGGNLVYDPKQNDWMTISSCNTKRNYAACTVFQGRCVVIGGTHLDGERVLTRLKSVETFDDLHNTWSLLACMQVGRLEPGVVTKRNKIFVINGYRENTCEVYDSVSEKFSFIASVDFHPNSLWRNPVIFGDDILVFTVYSTLKYDIVKDKWFKSHFQLLTNQNNHNYACIKLHDIVE